jgi:hypothetical protein
VTTLTFRVAAADRDTGEAVTLNIPASSPEEAERRAQQQGWLVSNVGHGRRMSEAPSPIAPAAASPIPTSRLLTHPVTTIAAGVVFGHLAVVGLLVVLLVVMAVTGSLANLVESSF